MSNLTNCEYSSGSGSSESRSEASTPVQSINGSPPLSPSIRVRASKPEDTKTRLFGPPESSPRKIRNHMKSTVFSTDLGEVARVLSPKKFASVRRNPITGEVYDDIYSGGNAKINGNTTSAGSLSLPSTPVKIRQPPGGKSTIFY
ncbi:microtubule-associated protein Jupiter-like isoform X2 [Leptotrombidium deliense]|uniref:Microtubule-associated protein Jupiter-like isoform X2 n=1 Tax=Leptotrombidium deliense TaxID=299467 RepID=A0A443SSX2_9ACAR|nr:microtubule-associated protein Jupiter-like isoform X2 [Leptotrombidium deliense]